MKRGIKQRVVMSILTTVVILSLLPVEFVWSQVHSTLANTSPDDIP